MGEIAETNALTDKAPKAEVAEPEPTPAEAGEAEPAAVESTDATAVESAAESGSAATRVGDILTGPREILRHRASVSLRAAIRKPAARLGFAMTSTLVLLGMAGAAGGYVVPHTAGPAVPKAAIETPGPGDLGDEGDPSDLDLAEGVDPSDDPDADLPEADGLDDLSAQTSRRPADALSSWAVPIARKLGIPQVALEAYGYAELVLTQRSPGCKISWTTLAGIGKVESNHGRTGGSQLSAEGKAIPPIRGVPLNGQNTDKITDTDGGQLDGDTTWDRAVGPMQFIPSTWKSYGVDADNDGLKDPNDIDDAALSAGIYLCASGKDISTPAGWYSAVLRYNAVRAYAGEVFAVANNYGALSRN